MHRSSGFTLIEAMIGIVLSSAIILGVSQLFVANSQTYNLVVGQSTLQESGRFALSTIARSVQSAGYVGCFSGDTEIYKTFVADLPYEYDLNNPIVGFEGNANVAWNPTIAGTLPSANPNANNYSATGVTGIGIDHTTIQQGTDIITSTYIPEKRHQLVSDIAAPGDDLDVSDPDFDFVAGELALIHDCAKQTVFQITDLAGDVIAHATAGAGLYRNIQEELASTGNFETIDTFVSPIVSQTFYIAPSSNTNNFGQEVLSLWRKTSIDAPVELVDGIEDLQIRYGVDSDNNRVPNIYVTADAIGASDQVVAVRITVVATSIDDAGGTTAPTHGCFIAGTNAAGQYCKADGTDGLQRRSLTQTVALQN